LCEEAEAENRKAALDDLKFAKLGEQWPESVRQSRVRDGRPCLTINRQPAFIRQVVNAARQNRPGIKVHPVDSEADVEIAEIYNGLIRNIEQTSKADVAYDTAVDCAVSNGFGYFRINTDYADDAGFDLELRIERIANPFSVYGDPLSTASDSSDWNQCFVTEVLGHDAFRAKYKGADPVSWSDDSYVKLPAPWAGEKSVLVAEWWRRERVKRTMDYIRQDINLTQMSKIVATVNSGSFEIEWRYCSASSGEIDRCAVWQYKDNYWTIGRAARTCGVDEGVFQYPILVDANGAVWDHEVGWDYGGSTPYLRTACPRSGAHLWSKSSMKYAVAMVTALLLLVFAIRSPAPDYVATYKTPLDGITLTFETWSLPLTSDFNRLVVHYEHGGKKDSRFILEGEYAVFSRYVWASPEKLVLCWKKGAVFNFTNEVNLRIGSSARHFHVVLKEDCPG
jgi:hypothetical protein